MKPKLIKVKYLSILFITILGTILYSCKKKNTLKGEQLAKTYCSSCHQFPEPNLLPKNVWKHSTLPYMAILLGVKSEIEILEMPIASYKVLEPENQMISQSDWNLIKEFYLENAPKILEFDEPEDLKIDNTLFSIEKIDTKKANFTIPNFTLVSIDTLNKRIIAGDQSNKYIWVFDKNGMPTQINKNQNALTDIKYDKNVQYLTFMGKTTQANQEVNGLSIISNISKNELIFRKKLLDSLNRPVSSTFENFDESPENEILVTEFGFKNSGLSLWKKNKTGSYKKTYLSNTTGAIKTIVYDVNNDKRLDIIALFAQGDERIVQYINKGKLQFEEKILLRFPPIYGSSSLEMVDIDADGKKDIIYTAGDNADFTTIIKPYHGIYIFKNNGNNVFEKVNFFYQNGAYKTITKDFDLDGDLDICSISLFPDVENRPNEGFIYLENNKGNFIQKTLNINHLGRWSVMDAGDLDGDGDLDLVLGSHAVAKFPSGFDQAWKQGSGLIILRNNSVKK
jgi:hypothetical protein